MSVVQAPSRGQTDDASGKEVPKASAIATLPRRPASAAWAQLAAPLARGEGIRVLFFGITGSGKTTGIEDFLGYIEKNHLADLIFIHDVKKPEKQYSGEVIHEARDVLGDAAPELPARRVLRRRSLDHMPSVDGAARVVLECGYSGIDTVLVIDEFQRALTEGGSFEAPNARRLFNEGLGLHSSIIAAKQMPQDVPTEATGQADKVYFFQGVEGTNYLVDRKKISKGEADIMKALPVGTFMLYPAEHGFDGNLYEVPAP